MLVGASFVLLARVLAELLLLLYQPGMLPVSDETIGT